MLLLQNLVEEYKKNNKQLHKNISYELWYSLGDRKAENDEYITSVKFYLEMTNQSGKYLERLVTGTFEARRNYKEKKEKNIFVKIKEDKTNSIKTTQKEFEQAVLENFKESDINFFLNNVDCLFTEPKLTLERKTKNISFAKNEQAFCVPIFFNNQVNGLILDYSYIFYVEVKKQKK